MLLPLHLLDTPANAPPVSSALLASAQFNFVGRLEGTVVLNSMPNISTLQFNNDNLIELDGLFDLVVGTFINNATVTFTIVDRTGTDLFANTPMGYVAASSGNYQGLLTAPSAATLTVGRGYRVEINVVTTAGAIAEWNIPVIVQFRDS